MRGHGMWSFWGGLLLTAGLSACDSEAPAPAARVGDYQPATLSEAVLLRNRTAVENFLALGADPNEPEPDGTTPLMRAVHGQSPEIAEMLIAGSADVAATNSYGVTALYIAVRAGDAAETRLLLAAGADANTALPSSGETVLMTAAKSGNTDVVRALLTGGDDAVSLPEIGEQWSVAQAAESAGYVVPSSSFVGTNYANVNARERLYGRTALMIAAAEGHARIVQLLIEAGSDVNALDEEGSSPLSLARANGYLDVAAAITAAGGR